MLLMTDTYYNFTSNYIVLLSTTNQVFQYKRIGMDSENYDHNHICNFEVLSHYYMEKNYRNCVGQYALDFDDPKKIPGSVFVPTSHKHSIATPSQPKTNKKIIMKSITQLRITIVGVFVNVCTLHQLIIKIFHDVRKLCRSIGPGWLIKGAGYRRLTLYDTFFLFFVVVIAVCLLCVQCTLSLFPVQQCCMSVILHNTFHYSNYTYKKKLSLLT